MKKVYNGSGLVLEIDTDVVEAYAAKVAMSLTGIKALSDVVYKSADELQALAVENASGKQVTYDGRTFTIARRSGDLVRSIHVDRKPLAASVIANEEYASYVEEGVLHPVDMKPFLIGKIIPIRVAGPKGNRVGQGPIPYPVQGGYAGGKVQGNSNQDPATTQAKIAPKISTTGKKVGNYYLIFRRVSKTSRGWIIPPRLPRPFMAAAGAEIEPKFTDAIEAAVLEHFEALG
jgi:hypothetical protein